MRCELDLVYSDESSSIDVEESRKMKFGGHVFTAKSVEGEAQLAIPELEGG